MKKPFQTEDRVKVYATLLGTKAETAGTVTYVGSDDRLSVKLDTGKEIWAHVKQCRRVVPKKKKWEWRYVPVMDSQPNRTYMGTYGYRTIQEALSSDGFTIGYRRVKVYLK